MPKLWSETVDTHKRDVREAILDAAGTLTSEDGPLSVTMSAVAEHAGIGRATLYKYFSDVETILLAWHERRVIGHLEHLTRIGDAHDDAWRRLSAVLETYALISHAHHGGELSAVLHRGDHVVRAHHQLHGFVAELIADGVRDGCVRSDVGPHELASYCLHALAASSSLPSKASVHRLVTVTLSGLRPAP